ncbi:MAG: glycoside hydrolase family 127 protein [Clostridia bacterium]|nr:glycoside hydrolase family 127 protein [Clostridia bacterium]
MININGKFAEYLDIITERQLLDRKLWERCVGVFSTGIDNQDAGWRGEYWGKMMRGACLVYSVTRSSELLEVLTEAVNGLLSKQEKSGRISTYREDAEFLDWDMWARKYVMTGLQHFYDICGDEELKGRIMQALCAHADYIVDRIGEGKKDILRTGRFWGGVNAASILEPFVRLYTDTKNEKYLDFARYIISTGGCFDGSLIDCALNGLAPYQFPEQKAYETMSFFEGLLAYYEVTGEKKYLEAVQKFTDALLETDVTVIGSCGCTHELFDNSAVCQTEATGKIMQETCVTVTLIRFFARLYKATGDKRLADTIRLASLNALAGSLNINGFDQFSNEKKEYLKGLLFDSYSPLCDSKRGLGIGGFKQFADGPFFGCCACIASAGFALYPLTAVTESKDGISINYLLDGSYKTSYADVRVEDKKITLSLSESKKFSVRVTNGDAYTTVSASADGKEIKNENGFTVIDAVWNDGDVIELSVENRLVEKQLNGKISLNYGGFVLAADESKGSYKAGQQIEFIRDENGDIKYEIAEPEAGEQLRIFAETADGKLLLTDYAAAGQDGKSIVSVWFKAE